MPWFTSVKRFKNLKEVLFGLLNKLALENKIIGE